MLRGVPRSADLAIVVIRGLRGEGVSGSTRSDPQAKGLGEYLRAKLVEVPETLLG